jgi:cysteine desulfurase
MRIYLDNNATTAIHPDVLRVACDAMRDVYGNASSIHKEGQSARRLIEDAREPVARLLSATPREIVFTSGGSESNNAAIFGVIPPGGSHHIVTTAIEHPSVSEAVAALQRRGCAVTVVPPARSGLVEAARVIDAIRDDTRLVAMMLVNNETGVIQPVEDVGRVCRERGIHLHCDAVQAAGKIDVDVSRLGVDTLSLSAHKIHAPKGIGALYVRRGTTLEPLILGVAQERRRLAVTDN